MTREGQALPRRLRRWSDLCALAAALLSSAALLGWFTGWRQLASVRPHYIPMAPNTALCFLLLAGSLAALGRRVRWVAAGTSLLVLLVSVIRALEYGGHLDLGVDRWVFHFPAETLGLAPVGKMALFTAITLCFLAVANLLHLGGSRVVQRLGGRLGLGVAFLGLVFAVGYLYGAPLLYSSGQIPMALTTALSFAVLGGGTRILGMRAEMEERRLAEKRRRGWERELRLQKELLESILDSIAEGIVVADQHGRFLRFNRAAERILGMGAIEADPAEWSERYGILGMDGVTPYPAAELPLARALAGEEVHAVELSVLNRARGEKRWILVDANPLAAEPGEPARAVAVFRDITERREAEALSRQAREAAETASRAKSEFLAGVSHELRTPLNSIIGFSEILQDKTFGPLNERQQRYVHNILSSGRHLLDLINEILDLSKIEAGQARLEVARVDVGAIVDDVVQSLAPLAQQKKIRLALSLPSGLRPVLADAGRLRQILVNLVSNAVKFTPAGGWVEVGGSLEEDDGAAEERRALLTLRVRDTGIGIKPADQERIFEEFERVDSSYAREQEGTGLGLTLTRKLVELHGGQIRVESAGEEGLGSTFTVELPVEIFAEETPLVSGPDVAAPASSVRRLQVLVVEDDSKSGDLLALQLTEAGYEVLRAASAAQALEMARRHRPSVITLDLLLPDRHGWDVLEELRNAAETRGIPVVVVSVVDDRDAAQRHGAKAFLLKPVGKEDLLEALRAARFGRGASAYKVLVIDDDASDRQLLAELLTARGFTVACAASGREGIEIARKELPDIVILDLVMPGIGGFEVLQAFREEGGTRTIPVLIFTARDVDRETRERLAPWVQGISSKSDRLALLAELDRLVQGGAGGTSRDRLGA